MTDEELRQEFRNINARFDNIHEYFMEFRSEVIQRFDHIEHRLDFQGASLSALTKQALDSDSSSSRPLPATLHTA